MGLNENVAARYDAFISYRHSELDKYVAQTLQRKLENYKVPKSVLKGKNLTRTKISRVFRDQDELPLASNLSEPIEAALKVSDFLIVICSPRLPLSEWCKKEIETFIELNGRERVLAVLCEGEPYESFPEALVKEKVVTVDENGYKFVTERNIEPLAADVRGKSKKEINKLIDDAVLRITAAILGINYDDLKQRHKEQRFRRMLAISAAIAAFFLVFSLVSTFLLIKINTQSKQILEQNDQILEQNSQITAQSEQIKNQYIESRKEIAVSTAKTAHQLMGEGRRKDALYALLSVAPDSKSGTDDKPYVPELERMLVEAVQPYASLYDYVPEEIFVAENGISCFKINSNGKYVAILDEQYNLLVFDTKSAEKIYTCEDLSSSDKHLIFVNDKTLFYVSEGIGHMINLETMEDTELGIDVDRSYLSPGKDKLLVTDFENYHVFDAESLKLESYVPKSERSLFDTSFYIDNKIVLECKTDDDISKLEAVSLTDGSVLWEQTINGDPVGVYVADDDNLYIRGSVYSNGYESVLTTVYCIDKESGAIKWQNAKDGMYIFEMKVKTDDTGVYLIATSSSHIYIFNAQNGDIIFDKEYEEKIISSFYSQGSPLVGVIMADGAMNTFFLTSDSEYTISYFALEPGIPMSDAYLAPSMFFMQYRNKNYVSKYALPSDDSCVAVDDYEKKDTEEAAKKVKALDDGLYFYEGDDEEPYKTMEYNTFNVAGITVSEDEKYAFIEGWDGQLTILNMDTLAIEKVIYADSRLYIDKIVYDEALNSYIVMGSRGCMLNEKFDIVADLGNVVEYNADEKTYIINKHSYSASYEYKDYNSLLDCAREILGDYVPDAETKTRYSLN